MNELLKKAHKELNGDLGKGYTAGGVHLFFNQLDGRYVTFDALHHQEKYYQYICTVKEFNEYVPYKAVKLDCVDYLSNVDTTSWDGIRDDTKVNNMKTVMDAVIEFKGKWPSSSWFMVCNKSNKIVGISYGLGNTINSDEPVVCGWYEFADLVDHLASNMGSATESYAEYKRSLGGPIRGDIFGFDIEPSQGEVSFMYTDCDSQSNISPERLDNMQSIPDIKPVYTQELNDNGELPSIGMECTLLTSAIDKGTNGYIEYQNEVGFLFRYSENNLCDFYENSEDIHFKPLTPPITLEDKALNDMVEQLTYEGIVTYDPIMLRILIEKFKGGKISGVSFKPLTVEGE